MSFKPANSGTGVEHSMVEKVLLYNSLTFAVGEAVESFTVGYATHATAAAPLLGIIVGFVDQYGKPLQPTAYAAGSATGTTVESVTTGASNTTNLTYYALVDTSPKMRWSAEINGTLDTTVTSSLRGCKLDIDSANSNWGRLLETTATRTAGTAANFYSHGVDPSDSTRLIVSIAEPEFSSENS